MAWSPGDDSNNPKMKYLPNSTNLRNFHTFELPSSRKHEAYGTLGFLGRPAIQFEMEPNRGLSQNKVYAPSLQTLYSTIAI